MYMSVVFFVIGTLTLSGKDCGLKSDLPLIPVI